MTTGLQLCQAISIVHTQHYRLSFNTGRTIHSIIKPLHDPKASTFFIVQSCRVIIGKFYAVFARKRKPEVFTFYLVFPANTYSSIRTRSKKEAAPASDWRFHYQVQGNFYVIRIGRSFVISSGGRITGLNLRPFPAKEHPG